MRLTGNRRGLALLGAAGALAVASAVALVGAASADTEGGTIRGAGSPTAIKNSYIVVLKDRSVSANSVHTAARSLMKESGGSVRRTWGSAMLGFEASMSERAARRMARKSQVAFVEVNQMVRISATQNNPPSFGLDRVDQRNLPLDRKYTSPSTASSVTAYVIDTGIDLSHREFGGRAVAGFDAFGGESEDCNGHGTHVAGTVGGASVGLAKGVRLVAVRALDCTGGGSAAGVIAGINFVAQDAQGKRAVANMSLGGPASAAIDNAVQNAINAGVTFVAAAGNENQNACNTSPARVRAAITVGATDATDNRAAFSNFGNCLDIFAPGVQIISARLGSGTTALSGTSMSSPHVAGAAALILQDNPRFGPQQVANALVGNATQGVVRGDLKGSANRLLFVGQ